MAIRTRLSLLRLSQGAICICLAVLLLFFVAISCSAADMPSSVAPHADLLWQMVVALLGFVNAVLGAIAVWMISNIRELFVRMGMAETSIQVREKLCDERHDK